MDLVVPDLLHEWQRKGLAKPWGFEGRSGYRLQPRTPVQVGQLFQWAQEYEQFIIFSEHDAHFLKTVPLWLDTAELRQVRQYSPADFTLQVETGITCRELLAITAAYHQCFPLSYAPNTTLLEVLAEERPALETGLLGYPRDYVLKTELVTPDGEMSISGADVVKNVTGYDLAKLYVGGQNTFGLLTSVTLKLGPLPQTRHYWLVQEASLSSLQGFITELLAFRLPLSVCEVFQTPEGQWQLLLGMVGDAEVVAEGEALMSVASSSISPTLLDTRSAQSLIYDLQTLQTQWTVLEAAVPLSCWQPLLSLLETQSAFEGLKLQARPAAGLVYLYCHSSSAAALTYIQKQVHNLEGQLQLLQIGSGDVTLNANAKAAFAEFNIPSDPVVARLLCDLKKRYDPNGILWTPRLPLGIK